MPYFSGSTQNKSCQKSWEAYLLNTFLRLPEFKQIEWKKNVFNLMQMSEYLFLLVDKLLGEFLLLSLNSRLIGYHLRKS